jgi:hypothetical protein
MRLLLFPSRFLFVPGRLSSFSCSRDPAVHVGFAQLSEAEPDYHAHAASAFQRVNAGAMFTQPEVLHGVGVRWLRAFVMGLVKTEESSMPIVKMDRAVWVRTF